MKLSLYNHFGTNVNYAVQFVKVFIFQCNATIGPVGKIIYHQFVVRPGAVYGYTAANFGALRNDAFCLTVFEFGPAFGCGIVEHKHLMPFLMRLFGEYFKGAFRCTAVTLSEFVGKIFVAEYYGI